MRMLVLEDEAGLREQVVSVLRQAGYAVDAAGTGMEGLFLGDECQYDVAVVDIGLPDISGIEVIRRWRANKRAFPVLILTAHGRWQEKVEGLESGADDYLVKPVHMEELLARVRALVRRASGWAQPVLSGGPITLDTKAQTVTVAGEDVELTAFEYKILEYLMHNRGKVISKTELTEHIYDQDFDRDSNVMEVLVGRLRRKLDPQNRLHPIETLRGRGYRFELN